jgi:hypothetical protein
VVSRRQTIQDRYVIHIGRVAASRTGRVLRPATPPPCWSSVHSDGDRPAAVCTGRTPAGRLVSFCWGCASALSAEGVFEYVASDELAVRA